MDGIKKKPAPSPFRTTEQFEQRPHSPYQPKKEALYISESDVKNANRHEKSFQKGKGIKKILLIFSIILFLLALAWTAYFSWKTYSTMKKMNSGYSKQTTLTQDMQTIASPIIPMHGEPLKGEQEGRINILLLGAAGEHKPGGNLTDTVMVMSIDTKNKKVALLSLPRDLYAQIPESNSFAKINSLYPIGIKEGRGAEYTRQAVEKITGLNLQYYLVVDFDGFQKIIDDIGGINIISERDILDNRYPGPNYSYETFSLSKGLHKLDGATALKYVRERHNDPEGDFGRAKRQQQVIQAVKNKLFSAATILNVNRLSGVLNTLGDSVRTSISFGDIERFIELSKEVDTQNVTNVVVDAWNKDSLLKVSHIMVGDSRAFILVPRVGNYSEIQDLASNIFDQNQIKKRQNEIISENASVAIINKSEDLQLSSKIRELLSERLGIKNVRVIQASSEEISEKTLIHDNTQGGKIFTLDELIKKLPASLADKPATLNSESDGETEQSGDIIVTLGSDIVETHSFEEDSIEDFNKAQDQENNF